MFCAMSRVAGLRPQAATRCWRQVLPCVASGLLLTGCGWMPFSRPRTAQEDLIQQLLYDAPGQSSLPKGQPARRSRSDPLIPTGPNRSSRVEPALLTLDSLQRCLRSRGIPAETIQEANPTNYDSREQQDAEGQPVESAPRIIVLHETVASEEDTLNLFRTPHPNESDQASYHMLIPEDGRRVRIVDDGKRAFGAGNSAFSNYTIRLKPNTPGSINNIALHLSFVSPPDGRGEAPTHSGYSPRQYRSAAAQVLLWQATYGIPLDLLTTHKAVDRSQTRTDPRSFDWRTFLSTHHQLATACGLEIYTARR